MKPTLSNQLAVAEGGAALRTHALGKSYDGEAWALRDTSVELAYGRFIALIGANGAGKTTFMHLLCGVLNPTEGSFEWARPPARILGWCSQHQVIDWYLTVRDNVEMGARLAGVPRKDCREAAMRALRIVDLESKAEKATDELSGGQQQRLMIARALVHDPPFLVLDEPTVGLDAVASDTLLGELRARADAGALVLVSSHDLSLVEKYCDEVLFLSEGAILTHEPRESFLRRFAGEEVVTIEYEGDLPAASLERLQEQGARVTRTRPLELLVPRNLPIGDVVIPLEQVVRVIDINRHVPGLREAYLKLSEAGLAPELSEDQGSAFDV